MVTATLEVPRCDPFESPSATPSFESRATRPSQPDDTALADVEVAAWVVQARALLH